MGKRKKSRGFEWVAEDTEGEAIERVERPNRSELKRYRNRLELLAKKLGGMPRGARAHLDLDPDVQDALDAYAATKATPNRRRKLLYVTSLMAELEVDADAIEDEL